MNAGLMNVGSMNIEPTLRRTLRGNRSVEALYLRKTALFPSLGKATAVLFDRSPGDLVLSFMKSKYEAFDTVGDQDSSEKYNRYVPCRQSALEDFCCRRRADHRDPEARRGRIGDGGVVPTARDNGAGCPASSILSGQRQLDFPMLFEIPAAVGAVGKVGIARVVRDFQGRWEGRKTCFWFSSLSTARLFPQPFGRRVCVVKEIIEGHFASADSKPASRFFLACSMR